MPDTAEFQIVITAIFILGASILGAVALWFKNSAKEQVAAVDAQEFVNKI